MCASSINNPTKWEKGQTLTSRQLPYPYVFLSYSRIEEEPFAKRLEQYWQAHGIWVWRDWITGVMSCFNTTTIITMSIYFCVRSHQAAKMVWTWRWWSRKEASGSVRYRCDGNRPGSRDAHTSTSNLSIQFVETNFMQFSSKMREFHDAWLWWRWSPGIKSCSLEHMTLARAPKKL